MKLLDKESWQDAINGKSLRLRVINSSAKHADNFCYYPRFDTDGGVWVLPKPKARILGIPKKWLWKKPPSQPALKEENGSFFVDVPSQATVVARTQEVFEVLDPKLVGVSCGRMYDKLKGWSTGTDLISNHGQGPLYLVTTNDTGITQRFFFNSLRPVPEDPKFGPTMKIMFFVADDSVADDGTVSASNGEGPEMYVQMAKIRTQYHTHNRRLLKHYRKWLIAIITVIGFIFWLIRSF